MQDQPNPPGRVILGETHCDRCGAARPPFDDEGLCRWCHKTERVTALYVAEASLEILEGALDAALASNVHVDDVRALFEKSTKDETGARWTLDQLYTDLRAFRDEELKEGGA